MRKQARIDTANIFLDQTEPLIFYVCLKQIRFPKKTILDSPSSEKTPELSFGYTA